MSADIPVVILCGGFGSRLAEKTDSIPKPMVEIGGRPILWHIMKIYARHGYTRFVLCLGYRGHLIKDYFLNYEAMTNDCTVRLGQRSSLTFESNHSEQDIEVTSVETGLRTMTGGRIKRVERFIDNDIFMVTYGDGIGDVDVEKLVAYHRSHGRLATITAAQPPSRYGILDLSDQGQVLRFSEKAQADWINAGFFVFDRRVLEYLHEDSILEQGPLQRLAEAGELMAYRHAGFWMGMDTYREFEALNGMWEQGQAPWKVW